MESLPHDVIEHILERLDVKSLLKFKLVSKQWNSTIQSRSFQERHSTHPRQSGNPDVLLVSACDKSFSVDALRTLMLGSSVSVKFPTPWENSTWYKAGNNSCDGLICLNDALLSNPNIVVNPTTRWLRTFPYSSYQLLKKRRQLKLWQTANLGFGKDKINGTYKPVWLYNSYELFPNNNKAATVCEVFDFTTNAWRYVVHASPYPILGGQDPVYLEGSLHWFAKKIGTTIVLSLDLHTETFQVMSEAPYINNPDSYRGMCNLDDRLCVYEENRAKKVIWSFDSIHKTWKIIYSIDLIRITSIYPCFTLKPLAVLDKEKLLVCDANFGVDLLIYDPKTQSCELAYTSKDYITSYHLCYFPSFISIV